jgi:hypothetical protein
MISNYEKEVNAVKRIKVVVGQEKAVALIIEIADNFHYQSGDEYIKRLEALADRLEVIKG